MKEIFSISTGVNVAKVKPTSKILSDVANGDDKSSTKDFLSVMFAQIKKSLEVSKEGTKLTLEMESSEEGTKLDLNNKGEQKSLENHLLEDLLKVISLLKNPDAKIASFPSLSNKLTKLINSKTALKELKDINNITDLLKLSKKYDLGLEKFSVKSMNIETLKKEFPILAKKEFFIVPKEENVKVLVETKKESESKPTVLSISNIEKPKTEAKKEPTLFEKIMSTPKEKKKETIKEITKEKIVEEKKETIVVKSTQEVKKTIKVVQEEVSKVIVKEEQKELKTKITKEDLSLKEKLHVKIDEEVKKPEITRVNETKVESNIPKKGMIENLLQGIKTDKQTKTTTITTNESSNTDTKTTESNEVKTEPTINRNELKPQIKTDTIASKQLSPSRETFSNFAADFKEKLENYKPPFMRVQLALNPKGLGEVDVTIVNRGNNLHVNISSNTNTMSLFTQNQAEFKNSLVNMGFTNLEMNFSDQREKQEQKNSKSGKESSDFFEEENLEEETTSIELIVPQYV